MNDLYHLPIEEIRAHLEKAKRPELQALFKVPFVSYHVNRTGWLTRSYYLTQKHGLKGAIRKNDALIHDLMHHCAEHKEKTTAYDPEKPEEPPITPNLPQDPIFSTCPGAPVPGSLFLC